MSTKDVFAVVFFPDVAWLEAALAAAKAGQNVSLGVNIFNAGENCTYRTLSSMDPIGLDRIAASTEYKPEPAQVPVVETAGG